MAAVLPELILVMVCLLEPEPSATDFSAEGLVFFLVCVLLARALHHLNSFNLGSCGSNNSFGSTRFWIKNCLARDILFRFKINCNCSKSSTSKFSGLRPTNGSVFLQKEHLWVLPFFLQEVQMWEKQEEEEEEEAAEEEVKVVELQVVQVYEEEQEEEEEEVEVQEEHL